MEPLLRLTTERPAVTIDGCPYALTPLDALSFRLRRDLRAQIDLVAASIDTPALTPDGDAAFVAALDALVGGVLEAPPDVRARLSELQKLQIVIAARLSEQ